MYFVSVPALLTHAFESHLAAHARSRLTTNTNGLCSQGAECRRRPKPKSARLSLDDRRDRAPAPCDCIRSFPPFIDCSNRANETSRDDASRDEPNRLRLYEPATSCVIFNWDRAQA
ncbi:hypothetical protein ACCO45_001490 [Purpureocillium lilacinum]|uniref:Uncharacterized protein n=1 Tax=Purpureocillium lilacinum TaxID=33203 RepID=A0ACC4E749_PURLI